MVKKLILLLFLIMMVFGFYFKFSAEIQPISNNNAGLFDFHDSTYFKSIEQHPEFYFKTSPSNSSIGIFKFQSDTGGLYPNINITNDSFPQNEPSVKISRKNPNRVVAAWRDFRTGINPPLRRIGYSYSSDGGLMWSGTQLLPSYDSIHPYESDPAVCVDTAGNFYISTISLDLNKIDGIVVVYKSTDGGVTFNYKVNTAPHPYGYFDDKDYITCDLVPGSPFKNNLYAVWAGYTGDVLVRSTDGGLTWSNRIPVIPPNIGGGTGLDPVVGLDGELYVTWVGSDTSNIVGIYIGKSTNGGLNFGLPIRISQTVNGGSSLHLPSIAVDISGGVRNGYIYTVWDNYYNNNYNGDLDIFFSYSSNRGASWSIPKRVNNDSINNGTNQYWPWISVNNSGNISIVFYDCRNSTGNLFTESYLARSNDGGQNFNNEKLSSQHIIVYYPNLDIRFGDYIGIDSWTNKIIPVWTDNRTGNNQEIYTATVIDSLIGIQPIVNNIPTHFNLFQNYPNPFNPGTKIKYEVPEVRSQKLDVRLTIYDILGREVKTLVNEKRGTGTYDVEFDGSNFASGVYFYKLTINDEQSVEIFSETKKMVLLK